MPIVHSTAYSVGLQFIKICAVVKSKCVVENSNVTNVCSKKYGDSVKMMIYASIFID